jgi:hypothetical protein
LCIFFSSPTLEIDPCVAERYQDQGVHPL